MEARDAASSDNDPWTQWDHVQHNAQPGAELNLRIMRALGELTKRYLKNVFVFGVNDEVFDSGRSPICQRISLLGVRMRRKWRRRI